MIKFEQLRVVAVLIGIWGGIGLACDPQTYAQIQSHLSPQARLTALIRLLFPTDPPTVPHLELPERVFTTISEMRVAEGRPFPPSLDGYLQREFSISRNQPPIAQGVEGVVFQGTKDGQRVIVKVATVSPGNPRAPEAALITDFVLATRVSNHRFGNLFLAGGLQRTPEGNLVRHLPFFARSESGAGANKPAPTLAQRIRSGFVGPSHPERNRRIALQLAQALVALEESGIVHRDLKPDNILVDDSGNIRIIDFGIGSAIGSQTLGYGPAVRARRMVTGTPDYMSHAQFEGRAGQPDQDRFSMGRVLWELASGTRLGETAEGKTKHWFSASPVGIDLRRAEPSYAPDRVNPSADFSLSVLSGAHYFSSAQLLRLAENLGSSRPNSFLRLFGEQVRHYLEHGEGQLRDRVYEVAAQILVSPGLLGNLSRLRLNRRQWQQIDQMVRELQNSPDISFLGTPTVSRIHPNRNNDYSAYWRARRWVWLRNWGW